MRFLFLSLIVVSFFSFNTLKSSEINIHSHTHTHNQSALHSHEHIHSDKSFMEYFNTKENHQKIYEKKISFFELKKYSPNHINDGIFRPPIS